MRIAIAAAAVAVFSVTVDIAAQERGRFQQFRSAPDYWTADRIKNAKPAPMPQVDPDLLLDQEPLTIEPHADEPVQGEPGALPTEDATEDLQRQLHDDEAEVPYDLDPLADDPRANDLDSELGLDPVDEDGFDFDPLSVSRIGAVYTQNRVLEPRRAMQLHPYRQIGKLFYRDPRTGDAFVCSGAAIQLTLVATAGHCVFNAEGRYFNTSFLFVPGYARGFAPNGVWAARGGLVTPEWARGGGRVPNAADFAILWMHGLDRRNGAACNNFAANPNCLAIGEVTGWFGWRTNTVHRTHVTVIGYPGNLDNGLAPQETHAQPFQLLEPNTVVFGSGMGPGSSGGPYMADFGRAAAGQFPERRNRLVGIMSFGNLEARFSGTSILNASFTDMVNQLCDVGPDVCRR